MIEQDVDCIDLEMSQRMIHQDVESHAQVRGRSDGRVYVAEGGQLADLVLTLFEQFCAVDRIPCNFGQG